MAKPSDKEYSLMRKIKDLEAKNRNLENEIVQLKKKLSKIETVEDKPKVKKETINNCPVCNSPISVSELPFGELKICTKGCGWRLVKKK